MGRGRCGWSRRRWSPVLFHHSAVATRPAALDLAGQRQRGAAHAREVPPGRCGRSRGSPGARGLGEAHHAVVVQHLAHAGATSCSSTKVTSGCGSSRRVAVGVVDVLEAYAATDEVDARLGAPPRARWPTRATAPRRCARWGSHRGGLESGRAALGYSLLEEQLAVGPVGTTLQDRGPTCTPRSAPSPTAR